MSKSQAVALLALVGTVTLASSQVGQTQTPFTDLEATRILLEVLAGEQSPGLRKDNLSAVEFVARMRSPSAKMLDRDTASFNNYTLCLTRSGEKRYQVTLTPDKGCGRAWFASDAKVVYTGRALGCSTIPSR